jgi:hypothetical protein
MKRPAIVLPCLAFVGVPVVAVAGAAVAFVIQDPPNLTSAARDDPDSLRTSLDAVPLRGLPPQVAGAIQRLRQGTYTVDLTGPNVTGRATLAHAGRVDCGWGRETVTLLVPNPPQSIMIQHHRAGWPVFLLDGWQLRFGPDNSPTEHLDGVLRLSSTPATSVIPISPIWPSILAIACGAAVTTWTAVGLSHWLPARRRRRAGRCSRCAQPLLGSPLCPECGQAAAA